MKLSFILLTLMCCVAQAQHPLDRFLAATPIPTTIGTADDGLSLPVDLDFCRVPGRTHELWVLNKEQGNSSMSIFFHAGTPQQVSQYRMDSHAAHFMVHCPAFAMGANGNFSTVQEVKNSVSDNTSTFMGPVLWMSDTSVFARLNQSDWDPNLPLGSHIDMLHQSPYSMGIAADKDNIYWVFDGYHDNLCKYDFAVPHQIGGDDHSDGLIWRYSEVKLTRVPELPAHMVLDTATGWLYIVDNAKKRIIRVDTKSGIKSRNLFASDEPLALYWEMKNVVQEVYIDTGLSKPVGIDFWDGRLVITDNANGSIRLYDATGAKGSYLGSIRTGATGLMGVKIGPDSNLWYVDANMNTVTRLQPGEPSPYIALLSPADSAKNVPLTTSLRWESFGSYDSLQITVNVVNPPSVVLDTVITPSTSFTLSGLDSSTTYSWKVAGLKQGEANVWSPTRIFTTVTDVKQPATPVLLAPPNLAANVASNPQLVWNTALDATYYELQLAQQNTFTTVERQIDSTPTVSVQVDNLKALTTYYWHVRSHNEQGISSWSETWSFTTGASGVASHAGVDVQIYPNPLQTSLTIICTLPEPQAIDYELVNALGNTVRRQSIHGVVGMNQLSLMRGTLAAGSYLLRLRIGTSIVDRMVVIAP